MVLDKLLGGHTMKVTQLRLDHDWHLAKGLFDQPFGDSIDRPADVGLRL